MLGGTCSLKKLVQIYSAADIFLNLTYCDSYGLHNLEAALCERQSFHMIPVVVVRVGEIIRYELIKEI